MCVVWGKRGKDYCKKEKKVAGRLEKNLKTLRGVGKVPSPPPVPELLHHHTDRWTLASTTLAGAFDGSSVSDNSPREPDFTLSRLLSPPNHGRYLTHPTRTSDE